MSRIRGLVAALALVPALLTACGAKDDAPPHPGSPSPAGSPLVEVPQDAPTIQEAVDRVAPGGMVLVSPGTYHESVVVATEDVTVRGTDRAGVVIDGDGIRPHGIVGIADGVRIQNLTVQRTTFYGVLVTGLHDGDGPRANTDGSGYENFDPEKFPPLQRFQVDHVTAANNGLYGIYAFNAQHGVIRDNYASGSADSGFYVGQCHACDILVTGNVAERNAVGFENANASTPLMVVGNRFSSNRVGMTFLSDYQEAFIPQTGDVIAGNLVVDNNEATSPAQADGGFGIGIGISGGTDNRFVRNRVEGHRRTGISIASSSDLPALRNTLTGNAYAGNAIDFADISSARVLGTGNCPEPGTTTLPAGLPIVGAGCTAQTAGRAVAPEQVARLADAPPGMSFLEVPLPTALPGLTDVTTAPQPLPEGPTMPDLASVKVPGRSLLSAWVMVR
ncbi:right-handed parallel beta-helix repeat-containing protein [Pimelobacter simplex]|uniref:right-handed parallel beta-helix repeat-containing protein n=1 Tax=Nocardioides simplex TaxID=2045 RepID=UPI003AAE9E2B